MTVLLQRKITTCMIFLGLSLLGYISYDRLAVELLPNAELPMLFVQVATSSASSPEYIEQQGVIPVEGAIGSLEGVEEIDSRIGANQAFIQVSFKQDVAFKYAFLDLQQKIDAIKTELPDDIFVNVSKIDLQQFTNQFLELQIRGSGGTDRLRTITEQEIRPAFENLSGIASINVFGGRQKSLEIILDKEASEPLDITVESVRSKINQNSGDRTLAGYVYEGKRRYFIRTATELTSVAEIENLVMAPGPILLKDVAQVSFGVEESTSISRVNGKDAISVTLTKASQANIIDLSHQCQDLIKALNKQLLSKDVQIAIQQNMADDMENNINQIIRLALIGGLLAILVLWIFLKDLRLISIIAVSIPVSVLSAFNWFYGAGISINSLTLIGMALAVGMLLDNSIVVLENIYRLLSEGKSKEKSIITGVKEVAKAILAATLTTATVFLPFVFFGNYLLSLIGKNIGVSIISTLLMSLLVALFLIPVLAALVLRKNAGSKKSAFDVSKGNNKTERIYMVLLKSSLRNPTRVIIGGLLLFFLTAFAVLALNINALEEVESDQIDIYVTMAKGSTLEKTDIVVQEVESVLEEIKEKADIYSKVNAEDGVVTIKLQEEHEEVDGRGFNEIKEDIEGIIQRVGGGTISTNPAPGSATGGGDFGGGGMGDMGALLGFGNTQERILIKGEDYELIQRVGQDLLYFVQNLSETRSANLSTRGSRPEARLDFDPLTMARNNIIPENIALALRDFGQTSTSETQFKYGNEGYNIIIRESESPTIEEEAKTMDDLRTLEIRDQVGGRHQLTDISSITKTQGSEDIRRINQQKQIELTYAPTRQAEQSRDLLESYKSNISDLIANYQIPPGVAIELVDAQDQLKDFKPLVGAAFLLIFIILASSFESLTAPFVLGFSVPLAATGALLGLAITGNSLMNANTLTGFLILLGVIVNNGIILIDYVNTLRRKGFRKTRALMTAGLHRLRPIMITAITTIVAMFPLALGTEEYVGVIGAPFAVTVIGGLALGTVLTLILIPTVYLGMENAISWFRDLPLWIKIVNIALFIGGSLLVYFRVDALLWQFANILLLFFIIPGITYFIMESLKKASEEIISGDVAPHIVVQNLVKIYNRPGRFAREWGGSENLASSRKSVVQEFGWKTFLKDLLWQLPLLIFMIWFCFWYLENGFWMTVMAISIYLLVLEIGRPVSEYLQIGNGHMIIRVLSFLGKLIFWVLPFLLVLALYAQWEGVGHAAVIGVVWYLILFVQRSSHYFYRKGLKIERVKWRIRRFYYRTILSIPYIGKKKLPFKALSGISLEIGTGMYGLLGPNGAGKSTLMRIISGIFDQSYGKIWINGFDTQEKREELQGLIGYLPQAFGSYDDMSAWSYLDYQAILKGITQHTERKQRLEYVLEAVNMLDRKNEKISSFSGGMKQRIGIAQILLHLPRILIVDEPTAGLDPRERIRFRNLLVQLSRERIVLFSTHIIEDIASSCNQLAVIDKGEVKYQGSPLDMVHLANGLIWEYLIPANQFTQEDEAHVIVNHIREGENIKVRCISNTRPNENAYPIEPVLEDAYLCLLKNIQIKEND
ncbi:efflux RND transporter permease subunit [Portibacter marinus]|uniref:efflux RND transporter permease subunit n=1 Tax=Portibacter marinus TaxID=2898660 RepID=UPI001F365347|nr:efflux RND transporter permease subunit [Portibacter marinus]